ncbi:MAG: tetraacyldisaccharide 4'-kinase [Bdellovibrionales bacterium]
MREILFPARWVYQSVTGVRNWLYDHSVFKAHQVGAKVISVGNLTVGGTGKTPVTLALVEELLARDFSCGVVSRGYRREKQGVLEVDTGSRAAYTFGDEPALIKATFPEVPVLVGERRIAAAQALLASRPVDFIICDDAFQHRSLHRDLNLLLFDATESVRDYRVLPVGRARESLLPALRRADFLVFTKANLLNPEELKAVVERFRGSTGKPVLLAEYALSGFRNVKDELVQSLKDSVYLVSGIAKPRALELTLGDRVKVVKHKSFPDHHRYTDLQVETILDEASQLQARWILTTAKDSIKLKAFPRLRERLWVVELDIRFKGDVTQFHEAIDRLGRSGH